MVGELSCPNSGSERGSGPEFASSANRSSDRLFGTLDHGVICLRSLVQQQAARGFYGFWFARRMDSMNRFAFTSIDDCPFAKAGSGANDR